jgi:hypothetical protein
MDILFRPLGRAPQLARWEHRPLWPGVDQRPSAGVHDDVYEREVRSEGPGEPEAAGPYRRIAAALLRYHIFPPSLVQGVLRRVPLQVTDTVGILYHAPAGVDLFFAARVVACFDGPAPKDNGRPGRYRTGFTYQTLLGHPELGEETFSVEKDLTTGQVKVALRSWSRPGTYLARAMAPVVRLLQVHASRAALDHLQAVAEGG